MVRDIAYIIFGYLCGSILFARVFGQILHNRDITEGSSDRNPGTSNAFKNGGFLCGVLTLICDLTKGIAPVYLYLRGMEDEELGIALTFVIAAPVLGHIFPIFYRFKGGKGIAVSFGTLLGLCPMMMPVLILAATFIFFSLVVKISPHYYRTLASFCSASVLILIFADCPLAVTVGFLISSVAVTTKLLRSTEEKESLEVKLAWKH